MKKIIFLLFAITLLSSCVVNKDACPGVTQSAESTSNF
ncbi:MAG: lipoprotein [Flavobacteriales bacterium]|nr:lipoprotein [Flavobacteriales bacterium]